MLILKPFFRITLLSVILASLLIILGVKYHWGVKLSADETSKSELHIPKSTEVENNNIVVENSQIQTPENQTELFSPTIIVDNSSDVILQSMTKSQIKAECVSLMALHNNDPVMHELATMNCIVSNYQETFQDSEQVITANDRTPTMLQDIRAQCNLKIPTSTGMSVVQRALMIGICVSDKLNN